MLKLIAGFVLVMIPPVGWGNDIIDHGRRLYTQENSASATAVSLAGGITAPIRTFPCSGCHGLDGQGGKEGGVVVPPISREALKRSHGETEAEQFEKRVKLAVRDGTTPDGRALHPMMPRYPLTDSEIESLVAYLGELDHPAVPGVNELEIRIGLNFPESGELIPLAEAIRQALQEYIGEVNRRGGIWGRKLILQSVASAPEPFCYLLPMLPGGRATEESVPLLFPLGQTNRAEKRVLPLLADLQQQATLLVRWWLANDRREYEHALLVADDRQGALANRVSDLFRAAKVPLEVIEEKSVAEWPGFLLNDGDSVAVFWFAHISALTPFLSELDGRHPVAFYSGVDLVGQQLPALQQAALTNLTLSNPRGLPDRSAPEYHRYLQFRERLSSRLEHNDEAVRVAFAAAALLEEGLRRSGRRLNRAELTEQMETLHDFRTGALPPLGLARESGKYAQLIRYSSENGTFSVLLDWGNGEKLRSAEQPGSDRSSHTTGQ